MKRAILIAVLCAMLPAMSFAGGAIVFDGTDDYIDTNYRWVNGTDGTLAVWINTTGTSGKLISNYANSSALFYISMGDITPGVPLIDARSSNNQIMRITTCPAINDGLWHMVCSVMSGTTLTAYLDGVNVGSASNGSFDGTVDTGANFFIGRAPASSPGYISGSISVTAIYASALTSKEISAMYASGGSWFPKAGLVSRWSMDNNGKSTGQVHANGSTIKDSAGSNDGTIVDGADSSMVLTSSPVRKKRGRR